MTHSLELHPTSPLSCPCRAEKHNISQPLDVKPAPTKRIQKTAGHVKPIHRCPVFERQSQFAWSMMRCARLVSNKNKPPFWQSHPRSRPGHICRAASRKFSPKWSSPGSMEPLLALPFTLSSPNFTVVGDGSWAHGRFGSSNSLLDARLPSLWEDGLGFPWNGGSHTVSARRTACFTSISFFKNNKFFLSTLMLCQRSIFNPSYWAGTWSARSSAMGSFS